MLKISQVNYIRNLHNIRYLISGTVIIDTYTQPVLWWKFHIWAKHFWFSLLMVPAKTFYPQRIIVRNDSLYVYFFELNMHNLLYVINLTTLKLTLQ